jgi:hypothetical protein
MLLLACAFDFPDYAYRQSPAQLRSTSVIAALALGDIQHNMLIAECSGRVILTHPAPLDALFV